MQNNQDNNENVFGEVCLRKQRRKRQKLIITDLFLDYANNSTIHGLRYIAQKGLTIIEKVFWSVTFIISVILCSLLIKNVYIKWKTSPVIVSISERLVSVSEIPFPSVTICPQIKSKATVYNLSKEFDDMKDYNFSTNASDEYIQMLADVSMICDCHFPINSNKSLSFTNASIIEHIDRVSPTYIDFLLWCFWQSNYVPCNELFHEVYTAEGLCYNMNSLAVNQIFHGTVQSDYNYSTNNQQTKGWSLEDGYAATEQDPYPKRGSENGASPDLEVILETNEADKDLTCNGLYSGYKIYIQHPADFPQSSMYYYAALDKQVSSLAVSFNVLSTAKSLVNCDAEVRQCYFPNDKPLRYFKIYTAQNCRAECLSNYTFRECGCVGYYMPHDNSSQICAKEKIVCMKDARNTMAFQELRFDMAKSNEGCKCLPACNSVEYDAEILKTDFNLKLRMNKFDPDGIYNSTNYSKLDVYFKKPQFISMRRSELFGNTDFLANIGGLLGVFMGFSFLSLIEIIYFLTLRVGFSLKRDLKEEKRNRNNTLKKN